jgi:hypothetical protein
VFVFLLAQACTDCRKPIVVAIKARLAKIPGIEKGLFRSAQRAVATAAPVRSRSAGQS